MPIDFEANRRALEKLRKGKKTEKKDQTPKLVESPVGQVLRNEAKYGEQNRKKMQMIKDTMPSTGFAKAPKDVGSTDTEKKKPDYSQYNAPKTIQNAIIQGGQKRAAIAAKEQEEKLKAKYKENEPKIRAVSESLNPDLGKAREAAKTAPKLASKQVNPQNPQKTLLESTKPSNEAMRLQKVTGAPEFRQATPQQQAAALRKKNPELASNEVLNSTLYTMASPMLGFGESIENMGAYIAGGIAGVTGQYDYYQRWVENLPVKRSKEVFLAAYDTSDWAKTAGSCLQSMGGMIPSIATSNIGSVGGVMASFLTKMAIFLNAGGSAIKEATAEGAMLNDAFDYATRSGMAEAAIESLGGIPFIDGGKSLVGGLVKAIAGNNRLLNYMVKAADVFGEGLEEVISDTLTPIFKRMTYDPDAKNMTPEEIMTDFIAGMASALAWQGVDVVKDKISDMTASPYTYENDPAYNRVTAGYNNDVASNYDAFVDYGNNMTKEPINLGADRNAHIPTQVNNNTQAQNTQVQDAQQETQQTTQPNQQNTQPNQNTQEQSQNTQVQDTQQEVKQEEQKEEKKVTSKSSVTVKQSKAIVNYANNMGLDPVNDVEVYKTNDGGVIVQPKSGVVQGVKFDQDGNEVDINDDDASADQLNYEQYQDEQQAQAQTNVQEQNQTQTQQTDQPQQQTTLTNDQTQNTIQENTNDVQTNANQDQTQTNTQTNDNTNVQTNAQTQTDTTENVTTTQEKTDTQTQSTTQEQQTNTDNNTAVQTQEQTNTQTDQQQTEKKNTPAIVEKKKTRAERKAEQKALKEENKKQNFDTSEYATIDDLGTGKIISRSDSEIGVEINGKEYYRSVTADDIHPANKGEAVKGIINNVKYRQNQRQKNKNIVDKYNVFDKNKALLYTDDDWTTIKEAGDRAYKKIMQRKTDNMGYNAQRRNADAIKARREAEFDASVKINEEKSKVEIGTAERQAARDENDKRTAEAKQRDDFRHNTDLFKRFPLRPAAIHDIANRDVDRLDSDIEKGKNTVENVMNILDHAEQNKLLPQEHIDFLRDYYTNKPPQEKPKGKLVKPATGTYTDKARAAAKSPLTEVYETLSAKLGIDIERKGYIPNANGQLIADLAKIIIAADADSEYAALIHELGEFTYVYNNKTMQELQTALVDWYKAFKGEEEYNYAVKTYEDEGLSHEKAITELVNDALSGLFATPEGVNDWMEWLSSSTYSVTQKTNIFQKFADMLQDIINKITRLIKNSVFSEAAQNAMQMQADMAHDIRERFLRALEYASVTYTDFAPSGDLASVMNTDGKPIFSYKTMSEDKVEYRRLLKQFKIFDDETELDNLFTTIDNIMKKIEAHRNILDVGWDIDSAHRPFKPIKQNQDDLYKVSLDFSTLCRKRIIQQIVQARLEGLLNTPLSKEQNIAIRTELKKLRDEGEKIEIACALCYVESARSKAPKQINRFFKEMDVQLQSFFADRAADFQDTINAAADAEKINLGYETSVPLNKMPDKNAQKIRDAKKAAKLNYKLKPAEQAILDRAHKRPVTDFTTEKGLANLKLHDPLLYDCYTSFVRNATMSKGYETYSPWKIFDSYVKDSGGKSMMTDGLIKKMNLENGVRMQSWSDFQVTQILDYIGAIIEFSTRNAKMHAYTKVADFARLVGKTGLMVNLSLIPVAEYNGKVEFDPQEGIPFTIAMTLRDTYHDTVGTIAIGMNDDQIRKLMADPTIDYIIPYHASSMTPETRDMMGIPHWKDYEPYQNETEKQDLTKQVKKPTKTTEAKGELKENKKPKNAPVFSEWFDLNTARETAAKEAAIHANGKPITAEDKLYGSTMAMREAAKKYIALCEKNNLDPKFNDFKNEDNYWKVLIDRKMIDNITGELIEQRAVKPIFDEKTILDMMDEAVNNDEDIKQANKKAINTVVKNFLTGKIPTLKSDSDYRKLLKKLKPEVLENLENLDDSFWEAMLTAPDEQGIIDLATSSDVVSEIMAEKPKKTKAPKKPKFSLTKPVDIDSDGDKLSSEQSEYFKDSKVRNSDGKLIKVYHGTSKGGFTVFDTYGSNFGLFGQGSYFTENKGIAAEYTSKGKGTNKQVYEAYLNITNPLDMDAPANISEWEKAFPDVDYKGVTTNESAFKQTTQSFEDEYSYKYDAEEAISQGISGMGYDGITYIGGGRTKASTVKHRAWIAFEPQQIKSTDNQKPTSKPDIRYSLKDRFYSKLQKTVEGMKGNVMSANGLVKSLLSNGVKQDEITWSNIESFLEGKKSVNKNELLEYLRNNELEIAEVVSGSKYFVYDHNYGREEFDNKADAEKHYAYLRKKINEMTTFVAENGNILYKDHPNKTGDVILFYKDGQYTDTVVPSFSQFTFTNKDDAMDYARLRIEKAKQYFLSRIEMRETYDVQYKKYSTKGGSNYREILFTLPKSYDTYMSPHWDNYNVVAHTRLQDFTADDGSKVLFVDEVQSDWHEQGREEGYKSRYQFAEYSKKIDEYLNSLYEKYGEKWQDLYTDEEDRHWDELERERQKTKTGVADAPFKETWHEFVLKNILRYAAEGGYDRIAWTTGDQQADRYDLQQTIKNIYVYNKDGVYNIELESVTGIYNVYEDLSEKDLVHYLGKDMTRKVLNGENMDDEYRHETGLNRQAFEGESLKIGGEGMKNFYDIGGTSSQNIPKYLNKYGKQWGVQVDTVQINGKEQPSFQINKALKESVMNIGQPLFSKKGATDGRGQNSVLLHEVVGRQDSESSSGQSKGVLSSTEKAKGIGSKRSLTETERRDYVSFIKRSKFFKDKNVQGLILTEINNDAYNAEMKAIADEAAKHGVKAHFFVGSIDLSDGNTANGFALAKDIYIQYDDANPLGTFRHEIAHTMTSRIEYIQFKDRVYSQLTLAQKTKLAKAYGNLYEDLYGKDAADDIQEEYLCDLLSGNAPYQETFNQDVADFWNRVNNPSPDGHKQAWVDLYGTTETPKLNLNVGYHAGDLGKAESYFQIMSGNRSTGHFGTGTYFVGNKESISDGEYGKRPHESVDFSDYKLYKARNALRGMDLHDFLKNINKYIRRWDSPIKTFPDLLKLVRQVENLYETYRYSEDENDPTGIEAAKQLDNIAVEHFGERYLDQLKYKYDEKPWETYKDIYERFTEMGSYSYYGYMKDMVNWRNKLASEAGYLFNISDDRANEIIDSIFNEIKDYNIMDDKMMTADSPSTMFMKALGYEGVDVRGIDGLDNTRYGSVIYDLKGEALERKKANNPKFSVNRKNDESVQNLQAEIYNKVQYLANNGLFRAEHNLLGYELASQDRDDWTTKDWVQAQKLTVLYANKLKDYLFSDEELMDDKIATPTTEVAEDDDFNDLIKAYESIRRALVDERSSIERVGKMTDDKYLYAYIDRAARSRGTGMYMIGVRQLSFDQKTEVGKSLSEIFKPIYDVDKKNGDRSYREKFYYYLYHMHNIDRMSIESRAKAAVQDYLSKHPQLSKVKRADLRNTTEGQEYLKLIRAAMRAKNKPVFSKLITADESKQTAAFLLKENPEFDKIAKEVWKYCDNLLTYRVDSKLISQETADFLRKVYPHYVPTFRVKKKSGTAGAVSMNARTAAIAQTLHRAKGGNEDLNPIDLSIGTQTLQVVNAASRNVFGLRLLELAKTKSIGNYVKSYKTDVNEVPDDVDTFDEYVETSLHDEGNRNTFMVYDQGKAVNMILDNGTFRAIKSISNINIDDDMENVILVGLMKANQFFKNTTTGWNPNFTIRNPLRDFQDVLIYSRDLSKWVKNVPKAMMEIKNDGKYWQMYQSLGLLQNSYFDYNKGILQKKKNPFAVIENLNVMGEHFTRFVEFMAVLDGDTNPSYDKLMDASLAAADVTLNYNRAGTWIRWANRTGVPYLNPSVQGVDKMVRTFAKLRHGGLKDWLRFIIKMLFFGLNTAAINIMFRSMYDMMGYDDMVTAYDNLPAYDKDVNFCIPIPWFGKAGTIKILKFPKGRLINVLGIFAQRTADAVQGKPEAFDKWIDSALSQISISDPFKNNFYTAYDAAFNTGINYYGEQIEPAYMQNEPDASEHKDANTDIISEAISNFITMCNPNSKITPKRMQYMLQQYTGIFGDALPFFSKAGKDVTQILLGGFMFDPVYSNKISNDFYNKKQELYELVDDQKDVGTKYSPEVLVEKFLNHQADKMSAMYQLKRDIDMSSELSNTEKVEQGRDTLRGLAVLQKQTLDNTPKFTEVATMYFNAIPKDTFDDEKKANQAMSRAYYNTVYDVYGAEQAISVMGKKYVDKANELKAKGVSADDFFNWKRLTEGNIGVPEDPSDPESKSISLSVKSAYAADLLALKTNDKTMAALYDDMYTNKDTPVEKTLQYAITKGASVSDVLKYDVKAFELDGDPDPNDPTKQMENTDKRDKINFILDNNYSDETLEYIYESRIEEASRKDTGKLQAALDNGIKIKQYLNTMANQWSFFNDKPDGVSVDNSGKKKAADYLLNLNATDDGRKWLFNNALGYGGDVVEFGRAREILAKDKTYNWFNQYKQDDILFATANYYDKATDDDKAMTWTQQWRENGAKDKGISLEAYMAYREFIQYRNVKTKSGQQALISWLQQNNDLKPADKAYLLFEDSPDQNVDEGNIRAAELAKIEPAQFIAYAKFIGTLDAKLNGETKQGLLKKRIEVYVNSLPISAPQKAIMLYLTTNSRYDQYKSMTVQYIKSLRLSKEDTMFLAQMTGLG